MFRVSRSIFHVLPSCCIKIITTRNLIGHRSGPTITSQLSRTVTTFTSSFRNVGLGRSPRVIPCHGTFHLVNVGPGGCLYSVRTLTGQIRGGGTLPRVGPTISLNGTVSLRRHLPVNTRSIKGFYSNHVRIHLTTRNSAFLPVNNNRLRGPSRQRLICIDNRAMGAQH